MNDVDLVDFDGGVLTATIAVGSVTGDSLFLRDSGNGPGQVGISGSDVSFGGTVVGTIAGGTAGSPLTVTFNAASTQAAVQGVARAIAFQTTSLRLAPLPRTIQLSLTDGDGGTSDDLSYILTQSQVRRFGFQEGVDAGQGVYSGAGDVVLAQSQPNTHLPIGGNPAEGLLVDYDAGSSNAAVLLRFDNIFGSGAGRFQSMRKFYRHDWYSIRIIRRRRFIPSHVDNMGSEHGNLERHSNDSQREQHSNSKQWSDCKSSA